MLQTTKRPDSPVSIIGAGIAGAWQALLFAQAGHAVTLHERGDADMTDATSHWAGGMLAPYCEAEVSEPIISRLGLRSLDIWRRELPDTPFNGSLVVAHPRERNDFERFARMTEGHRRLHAPGPAQLRPPPAGRLRAPPVLPGSSRRSKAASATRCSFRPRVMSSRAACCRNCTSASAPPAAPSNSKATSPRPNSQNLILKAS